MKLSCIFPPTKKIENKMLYSMIICLAGGPVLPEVGFGR